MLGIDFASLKIAPTDIPFVGIIPGVSQAVGVVNHGVRNEITAFLAPLSSLKANTIPWKKLCDVDDDITNLDGHGDDLYLLSHRDASRYKVLHTGFSNPNVASAETAVPASQAVVRGIAAAQDAL